MNHLIEDNYTVRFSLLRFIDYQTSNVMRQAKIQILVTLLLRSLQAGRVPTLNNGNMSVKEYVKLST